jgi:ribosomal protein L11 methyltransferase
MWHEFQIKCQDDLKEPVIATLYELGCQGITEGDGELTAYFQSDVDPARVTGSLSAFSGVGSSYKAVPEQDWYASWKENFKPFHSAGIMICPPWEGCNASPDEKKMILDPGQAFGTGDHVTTSTVLGMLRSWAETPQDIPAKRFLDLGTGTGVLSIAAALYGVVDITAVDVEDDAIHTAARNISLNNMSERISLIHGSIKEAGRGYDFIAANIFQEALLDMIPDIAAALNKNGKVAVSGLLSGQEEQVIQAAKLSGLEVEEVVPGSGWVSILFRN